MSERLPCSYILTKGAKKGEACGKKFSLSEENDKFCATHFKRAVAKESKPPTEKKEKKTTAKKEKKTAAADLITKAKNVEVEDADGDEDPFNDGSPPPMEIKIESPPVVVVPRATLKLDKDTELIDISKNAKKKETEKKQKEELPPAEEDFYAEEDGGEEDLKQAEIGTLTEAEMQTARENFLKEKEAKTHQEPVNLLTKSFGDIEKMDDGEAEREISKMYNSFGYLHKLVPPERRGDMEPKEWLKALFHAKADFRATNMVLKGGKYICGAVENIIAPLFKINANGYAALMSEDQTFTEALLELKEDYFQDLASVSPEWRIAFSMGFGLLTIHGMNAKLGNVDAKVAAAYTTFENAKTAKMAGTYNQANVKYVSPSIIDVKENM